MLRELLDSLKIRLIHLWGGILPHEAGILKPETEEIKTIVHVGPHLHFADMKQALAEDIAHQMLMKGMVKIDRVENETGTRFEATAKVVWPE